MASTFKEWLDKHETLYLLFQFCIDWNAMQLITLIGLDTNIIVIIAGIIIGIAITGLTVASLIFGAIEIYHKPDTNYRVSDIGLKIIIANLVVAFILTRMGSICSSINARRDFNKLNEELATMKAAFEKNFDTVRVDIAETNEHVADVKKDVAETKEHVTDVKKDVAETKEHVTDVKKDVAETKEHVGNIQVDVAETKEHVAEINSKTDKRFDDIRVNIAETKEHVAEINSKTDKGFDDIRVNIAETKEHVAEIRDQIAKNGNIIVADVKKDVDDLKYTQPISFDLYAEACKKNNIFTVNR